MRVPYLARCLRGWADAFDPPLVDEDGDDCFLDGGPAMDRAGAALSLLDDECLGFFMLQVREGETATEVKVAGDVGEEYWEPTGITLHQVARMAYGVRY